MKNLLSLYQTFNSLAALLDESDCDHNSLSEDENQQNYHSENDRCPNENVEPSLCFNKVRADQRSEIRLQVVSVNGVLRVEVVLPVAEVNSCN